MDTARRLVRASAVAAAYLTIAGSAPAQVQLLDLGPPVGPAQEGFGGDAAMDAATLLVGAALDDGVGVDAGVVYVFDAWTGTRLAALRAPGAAAGDLLGTSCDLEGGLALVGAPGDDEAGADAGAAWLFDLATGLPPIKLVAPIALPGDGAGHDVALADGLALVGTSAGEVGSTRAGRAFVFDARTGQFVSELVSDDVLPGDGFGTRVALDSRRALVGAPAAEGGSPASGAAYVFDPLTGQQLGKLVAPDGGVGQRFGASVALQQARAYVGAPAASAAERLAGAVYCLRVEAGTLLWKAVAPDGAELDRFGEHLAVEGERLLVGAPGHSSAATAAHGAAYAYNLDGGLEFMFAFTADDPGANEMLGWRVALDGDHGLAVRAAHAAPGTGSALTFSVPIEQGFTLCTGTPCPCGTAVTGEEGCPYQDFPWAGGTGITLVGTTSLTADDLIATSGPLPPGLPAVLVSGTETLGGRLGRPLGDGVACAGGAVARLGFTVTESDILLRFGPGLFAGADWAPGTTVVLQVLFRNPDGPCGTGFNWSGARGLVISP